MENKRWIVNIVKYMVAVSFDITSVFFCDLHKSLIALFGAKACVNKSGMSDQEEDCKIHISQQTTNHFEETMNATSTN